MDQKTLATWIAKTAMVLEFADRPRVSSSAKQRRLVMDFGRPPDGWTIWVANYGGTDWRTKAARISAALELARGNVRVVDRKLRPRMNTQSVTFGVGCLLVQVMATTIPDLSFDIDPKFIPYTPQIWPLQQTLDWPPRHTLNDADALILTNGLGRMLRNDPDHIDFLPT